MKGANFHEVAMRTGRSFCRHSLCKQTASLTRREREREAAQATRSSFPSCCCARRETRTDVLLMLSLCLPVGDTGRTGTEHQWQNRSRLAGWIIWNSCSVGMDIAALHQGYSNNIYSPHYQVGPVLIKQWIGKTPPLFPKQMFSFPPCCLRIYFFSMWYRFTAWQLLHDHPEVNMWSFMLLSCCVEQILNWEASPAQLMSYLTMKGKQKHTLELWHAGFFMNAHFFRYWFKVLLLMDHWPLVLEVCGWGCAECVFLSLKCQEGLLRCLESEALEKV